MRELPFDTIPKPTDGAAAPALQRHYDLVPDLGLLLALVAAGEAQHLATMRTHVCLRHITARLVSSGLDLRVAAVTPIDSCRRPCGDCEPRERTAPRRQGWIAV